MHTHTNTDIRREEKERRKRESMKERQSDGKEFLKEVKEVAIGDSCDKVNMTREIIICQNC
jgi:hypothetical protein